MGRKKNWSTSDLLFVCGQLLQYGFELQVCTVRLVHARWTSSARPLQFFTFFFNFYDRTRHGRTVDVQCRSPNGTLAFSHLWSSSSSSLRLISKWRLETCAWLDPKSDRQLTVDLLTCWSWEENTPSELARIKAQKQPLDIGHWTLVMKALEYESSATDLNHFFTFYSRKAFTMIKIKQKVSSQKTIQ